MCTHDVIILRVSIYGGKSIKENDLGKTAGVVIHLMNDYLDKGYSLFTDNYYSRRSTYITGTLRKDRKGNPKSVTKAMLKKGEVVWKSQGEVVVCKWKDKRDILTISTAHIPEMVRVTNRRGQEKMKPNLIKHYNTFMSGIDRSDQMLSYHSSLRKTWYKKIGVYFLEMLLANAHYLYKAYSPTKRTVRINYFREEVVKWLLGEPVRPASLRPRALPLPWAYSKIR